MRPPPISKRPPKFSQWQPHIWNFSGAPVMIKQSVNSAFVISKIIYKKRLELSWRLIWSLYLLYLLRFPNYTKTGSYRYLSIWFDSIRFRLLPFDFEYLDCYWPASPWLPALLIDLLATGFLHVWLSSWPRASRAFDWSAGHWLPALLTDLLTTGFPLDWPAGHWLPALFTDLLATGFPHWSRWFDSDFLLMRFFVCLFVWKSFLLFWMLHLGKCDNNIFEY